MADLEAEPTDAQIATLVALADGSLPRRRRPAARRMLERSPNLSAQLALQQRAVVCLRALDVRAPASLRAHIEAERHVRRRTRRRRAAFGGALAGGLAVAALAAAAVLLGTTRTAPTVAQVAALATRAATVAPPLPQSGRSRLLDASFAGVPFPDYGAAFGWAPSGMRSDELDGRGTRTVFYERRGRRIAYTIVAGAPLEPPAHTGRIQRDGIDLRVFTRGDATIVTWTRDDHTCVLTGTAVPPTELLALAAWKGDGAIDY